MVLSPCTWYSADGRQRRNDKFRPLLHSLSCGAASPTATVKDSLAAAPRLCPHRCGCLARGNAGWSHCSWPNPCPDSPATGIPRVPESPLRSSFTQERRGLQPRAGSALGFPLLQTCTWAGHSPWYLGWLWGTLQSLVASKGWSAVEQGPLWQQQVVVPVQY